MYNTHVYAVVRVKVIGTNLSSSPKQIAEAVEFAEDISGVLIDEIDPGSGRNVKEHLFDWDCMSMTGLSEFRTRREADLVAEVELLKAEINSLKGDSK